MLSLCLLPGCIFVALRKESVDRNTKKSVCYSAVRVALRKESVDRNLVVGLLRTFASVALRKESVDRNCLCLSFIRMVSRRSP